MLWGAILLAIFACWWSTLGADLSDDAHNIALAWRMSLGDAPFVDEMNSHNTAAGHGGPCGGGPADALPYHLGQISYNTMPILGLVLGTAAGLATVFRQDRRWAFVCGAAIAAGVISYPLIVVGGVILLVAVVGLSRRRAIVVSVVLGGLAVSLPFGLLLLVGVGPSFVRETTQFTLDYQALRLPVEQRGRLAFDAYPFYLGLRK